MTLENVKVGDSLIIHDSRYSFPDVSVEVVTKVTAREVTTDAKRRYLIRNGALIGSIPSHHTAHARKATPKELAKAKAEINHQRLKAICGNLMPPVLAEASSEELEELRQLLKKIKAAIAERKSG